ncbi:MAG: ATP-binding cassette domain-containing protein [Desulfurococcales archaeon]|nr:ATP-binding cassette domain-containing protein [Desulfurococcales archaeon]
MPIEAVDLEVRLAGKTVVRRARISAGQGELHVILGRNGAGKTSLLKAIAGLVRPSRGRIIVDGFDVTREKPSRRRLGVVLQGAPLLPAPTVLDHIMLPLIARGVETGEARARAAQVASLVGVDHLLDRRPWRLSGGERQRVAIATALAMGTRNLVLDEPFSSLDPEYRRGLYSLIYRLRGSGYTILVATHILDDLVYTSDTVWVMDGGRIIAHGDPGDIFSPSSPVPGIPGPPLTATIDCGGLSICREMGLEGQASIHYTMLLAVKASHGPRLLGIVKFNGDRVGIVDVDGMILYALASDDVVPGDHVSLVPRSGVLEG